MKTLLTMLAWVAVATAAQETPFGTIEGTVVRQGTTDPIPDVQITLSTGASPALGQRQAQAVLDAVSGGTAGIPEELLEAAQNALRAGARGSVVSAPLTAVSDSTGRFVFRNVPAGNRVVRAQLQGYFGAPINGNYPATVTSNVTVTTQQTTQVRFSLIPGGTISGRVLDPAGKPLADSPVQALRSLYQNGVRTLGIVDLKPTDDRGEYRIARLPPGEYYVSASPRRTPNGPPAGAPNSSEVPIVTLYPNAADVASARPIVVREGDEQSGMNVQIRTAPGAKVSGKVISSLPPATGQRGQARPSVANLTLVPRNSTAVPDLLGGSVVSSNAADGSFEFSNVPSGSYELFVRFPIALLGGWGPANTPALATGPWTFARTPVEVRGLNVSDLAVVVRGGTDITGQLVVDGKPAQANVRIGLVMDEVAVRITDAPTANTFGYIMTYQPPIAADGAFAIPLVPEGKYRFQVGVGGVVPTAASATPAPPPSLSLPVTAYVADIRQGSVSVYDSGFNVGSEAVNPFQVLVNTNGGSLEGTVAGADRKPVPAVTVVLVPAISRRLNPALYRNIRSDAQGHFLFNAVPPGQYKVFAWENVPLGAWQNAEFLARYEQRGVSVTVNPGTRTTAETGLIRD